MMRGLSKPQRMAAWFVVIAYAIGSPAMMAIEFQGQIVSQRFGYGPEFIYLLGLVQIVCAILLFSRRFALCALTALTALSIGAVWSHFKIGSPLTSAPAIAITALQVWIAVRVFRAQRTND